MFKANHFILIFLSIFCMHFSYADVNNGPTPEDLWLQATAQTRTNAIAIQNQIKNQQANQQMYQNQQQQQVLQTLTTIQSQQKAMMNNNQVLPSSSSFQAQPMQPSTTGTNDNPWVKPNPWQNTVQNPYQSQQYTPNTGNTMTNPTNSSSTIYVNPSSSEPQTPQKSGSNAVNIYK